MLEDLFFMLNAFTACVLHHTPMHFQGLSFTTYIYFSYFMFNFCVTTDCSPEICMRDVSVTSAQTLNNSGQNKL